MSQTQRIAADITALNNGAIAYEINEALMIAGKRLNESGKDQTINVQIKIGHSDVSSEIVKVSHKVHVAQAAPKPESAYAFLTPEGRLEVDRQVDAQDPALAQGVIQFPSKEASGGTD